MKVRWEWRRLPHDEEAKANVVWQRREFETFLGRGGWQELREQEWMHPRGGVWRVDAVAEKGRPLVLTMNFTGA